MTYRLTNTSSIIRIEDGATIPPDPANRDYQDYLGWVTAGGVPAPADPSPNPLIAHAKAALEQTDGVATRCFKAGVAFPAAWVSYTSTLRGIANGTDTTSTALPAPPPYPSGT